MQTRPEERKTPQVVAEDRLSRERFAERAIATERRYDQRASRVLCRGYRVRILRPMIRKWIERAEGGAFYSKTLRSILREQYDVAVGDYSYGPCLRPGELPRGTRIGRYCCFGPRLQVFRRNHPRDSLSLHPFFFNRQQGLLREDLIEQEDDNPLTIGHDVWIGSAVIILPGCRTVGNGAIIGAGAIVTKDVPAFSVVAGNPAMVIGHRFDEALCAQVENSGWWEKSLTELACHVSAFAGVASVEKLLRSGLLCPAGE